MSPKAPKGFWKIQNTLKAIEPLEKAPKAFRKHLGFLTFSQEAPFWPPKASGDYLKVVKNLKWHRRPSKAYEGYKIFWRLLRLPEKAPKAFENHLEF